MTYCLGIKLKAGIVAISDTRLTSGTETTSAKKYFISQKNRHSVFMMTSGLRSVRDKVLTYFQETLNSRGDSFDKMYKAANALGEELKRVSKEDKESLISSGLSFDLHTIIGGQLENDDDHKLFLVYPEGNWIEVGEGVPFIIIGNSGHGKPVLRRIVTADSTIREALKTGFLSFDSTRVSANDVDFPIDVLVYEKGSFEIKHKRYEQADLSGVSKVWGEQLRESVSKIPEKWMDDFV